MNQLQFGRAFLVTCLWIATVVALLFVFAAAIALSGAMSVNDAGTVGAVIVIVGALCVPVVFFVGLLWRAKPTALSQRSYLSPMYPSPLPPNAYPPTRYPPNAPNDAPRPFPPAR